MSNARVLSKQGNGPAFSAYNSVIQNVTNAIYTKVNLDTEEFDYGNNFSSGRFTPNVAGLYQISAQVYGYGGSTGAIIGVIYKNGSASQAGSFGSSNSATNAVSHVSQLIYLNGSTDYVELFAYVNATTSPNLPALSGGFGTRMSGFLVKAI